MPRKTQGKKAAILTDDQYENLMIFLNSSKHVERDKVMFILAFKCGLRAVEIAGLRWRDVLDGDGKVLPANSWIELPASIVKGGYEGQRILMHPDLRKALIALKRAFKERNLPYKFSSNLMYTPYGRGFMDAPYVAVYMKEKFKAFGIPNGSSHSGRRTFITKLARRCNEMKCSVKDVQLLARHADMRTTEGYIEPAERLAELAGIA